MQTTLISLEITWLLGVLIALIFGGYGWTTLTYVWLNAKIEVIKTNHIKHVEERLDALERRVDKRDNDDAELI